MISYLPMESIVQPKPLLSYSPIMSSQIIHRPIRYCKTSLTKLARFDQPGEMQFKFGKGKLYVQKMVQGFQIKHAAEVDDIQETAMKTRKLPFSFRTYKLLMNKRKGIKNSSSGPITCEWQSVSKQSKRVPVLERQIRLRKIKRTFFKLDRLST